jgi:hypothetical protein
MPTLPPERDLAPGRKLQRKEHLMHEIRAARTGRRRRWLVAGLLAPAALAALLGAARVLDWGQVHHPDQAGCYAEASVDADTTVIRVDGVAAMTEACAREWRAGNVRQGAEHAPRLVACVGTQEQVAWVFPLPDGQTCERLGLPGLADEQGRPVPARPADPVPPGQAARARAAEGLTEAVDKRVRAEIGGSTTCPAVAVVEPIVRDELRRRGLQGWRVQVAPDLREPITSKEVARDSGREVHTGPCTQMDVHPRRRLVELTASTEVSYPEG